jgi:dGTP triphosphohydrolase
LTQVYVIETTELEAQQWGHSKVIEVVFEAFCGINPDGDERKNLRSPIHDRKMTDGTCPARLAADYISSLTEHGILQIYGRLTGILPGSIRDSLL